VFIFLWTLKFFYLGHVKNLLYNTIQYNTEARRLSRPRWLVTYPDGLPACKQSPIQVLTGPSVVDR